MLQDSKATMPLFDLGLRDYQSTLKLQHDLHRQVVEGQLPGAVIVVEHTPCVTLGKNASEDFLSEAQPSEVALDFDVIRVDRGGEATAHMPGQLVVYPIFHFQKQSLKPKAFIDRLLSTVITCLDQYGVSARLDEEYPGVWVGKRKICAVGIRVKDRVSFHGLALNVANQLSLFEKIVPCGILDPDLSVTTMAEELGKDVSLIDVKNALIPLIEQEFNVKLEGQRAEPRLAKLV